MDKAKAAITDFMSKSGHHDTTVHEAVAPAVKHEVVKPHQHEEVLTAVDKEVHQDHYHRTVQPIQDREVLPEKHTAKLGAVQHREFDHRDADSTKRALLAEQQLFKDERRVDQTTYSQSAAAAVGGEHIHHHIHETIQPVIQKEVIQPEVIHTTVPIHEVHHNKATHHEVTALPPMTMEQFKAKGGSLTGREERYDAFEGVPKNIGSGAVGGFGAVPGDHKRDSHNVSSALKSEAAHGDYHGKPNAFHGDLDAATAQRSNFSDPTTGRVGTDGPIGHHTGHTDAALAGGAVGAGLAGAQHHRKHRDSSSSSDSSIHDSTTHGTTTTGKKPSLMDKLNPKVDADGDGKRGFMS